MNARILLGGRNPTNVELMRQALHQEGYATLAATTLEGLDQLLSDPAPPDLALIDLSGFERGIWERCERLHGQGVPFVLISPQTAGPRSPLVASAGGQAVLTKPLTKAELLGTVRAMLGRSG